MKHDVVIASACRTAIGSFGGSLSKTSAADLGSAIIKESLIRAGIKGNIVDEVIMGCVLQAGHGQNISRQASINAGIPVNVPCMTVNKVCGSGMRAISLAVQTILAGDNEIVVAGGTESMSSAPYLLKDMRWGSKMGNVKSTDSLINDALTDAFNHYHMGITAENLAEKFNISRREQDEFAALSQKKAEKAQNEDKFKEEIVPVEVWISRKEKKVFDYDEYPRHGTTAEKLSRLKPAFKEDGTVTAGNASGLNDGAAALVIMSSGKAQELGIKPIARIVSYSSAGVVPELMGTGPIPSTRLALEKAGLIIDDIDLIEANEAFAAQSITVSRELGFDLNKVNVNGGAIALGHPVGASGARILVTLLHEMIKRDKRYGLATLCIGGGMGTSVIIERI